MGSEIRNDSEDWADYVKDFVSRTQEEIWKLKHDQCCKCFYYDKGEGSSETTGSCDYILFENKLRGCSPFECKEKGIFKPRDNRKRTKALKAIASGRRK